MTATWTITASCCWRSGAAPSATAGRTARPPRRPSANPIAAPPPTCAPRWPRCARPSPRPSRKWKGLAARSPSLMPSWPTPNSMPARLRRSPSCRPPAAPRRPGWRRPNRNGSRRPPRSRPPSWTAKLPNRAVKAIVLMALVAAPCSRADATIIEQSSADPGLPLSLEMMPQSAFKTRLLQVGPQRAIKLPSQAAMIARTGDVIEIDAEAYVADVAVWAADNLTIRGVGGRAKLLAAGQSAENKATWVIKGRNAVIENIEFAEAVSTNGNGAGIRAESVNLTIRNCYFHDNQEGILSALNTTTSRII